MSDLLRPYAPRQFKSQDHGCRSSHLLTMTIHDHLHIRPLAIVMQVSIQQVLITLTNTRGLGCKLGSVHQFLQASSPLDLFLTKIGIFLSSDITHFSFLSYNFPSSFAPKPVFVVAFSVHLPPAGYQILTLPIANFNSCGWNCNSLSLVITAALLIVPLTVQTLLFWFIIDHRSYATILDLTIHNR